MNHIQKHNISLSTFYIPRPPHTLWPDLGNHPAMLNEVRLAGAVFHDEQKSKANPAFKDINYHRMLFREKHISGSFYKGFCLNVVVQPQRGVNVATFIFSGASYG